MNFTEIFNGMVGKDFIVAFNDNFRTADRAFLSILATLLYKVKSTDIKEFKVIEGVVSYTLEDPPEEGEEDTRTWTPVDITAWGNIKGTLSDQTDLQEALDSKAALDTVVEMNNILSTLRLEFNNLRDNYEDTEIVVSTNRTDIADLKEVNRSKVTSTNIKGIRVSDAEFQWTVDGITWNSVQRTTTVAWGSITGDISSQDDLMALFRDIDTNMDALSDSVTDLSNQVSGLSDDVSDLQTSMDTLSSEFTDLSDSVNSRFNTVTGNISALQQKDSELESELGSHEEDTNNPHGVDKVQIGLGNVDNTADMDKPISNPQKEYVDEAVAGAFDTRGLVKYLSGPEKIFLGKERLYNNLTSEEKNNTMAFVLANDWDLDMITLLSIISGTNMCVGDLVIVNKNGGKLDGESYTTTYSSGSATLSNLQEGSYTANVAFEYDDGINLAIADSRVLLNIENEVDLDVLSNLTSNVIDYLDNLMLWVDDDITIDSIVCDNDSTRTIVKASSSIDTTGRYTNTTPKTGYSYYLAIDDEIESETHINGIPLGDYTITYTEDGTQKTLNTTVTSNNIIEPIIISKEGE